MELELDDSDQLIRYATQTCSNTYIFSKIKQITKHYTAQTEHLNRTIRETNKARQVLQTRAYSELTKLVTKRDTALQRQWLCQQATAQLKEQLLGECGLC